MRPKSAVIKKTANIQQELEHQNQKAKILQEDRKNFWKQAEEIKEKNKQEIEKLKNQNKRLKEIRDQFISNRKTKPSLAKTSQNMSFSSSHGFNANIKDENYLRRLLDKQRHITKAKKSSLFNLQDKLKEVEQNKLGYIQESPLMRNIRILENRLDKVMIKYNQAQSAQKTYQQVVKRLKQERVGYDSQLAAIQNSLKGRQHDFQQLLLLAHDATHAKQAAYAQLKRFQQRRITVQEMRVKYVNNKKDQINKDIPQTSQLPIKQQIKISQNLGNVNYINSYKHDENYQRQQLQDYEEAFRKLKEVTGVIDANEIIQKFKTQGLTTNSLQQLKQSYKKRIQQLKQEKQSLKREIQDNKFIKESGNPERRRLDEVETELATVTNLFQRTNIKAQRLSDTMINIKAGIQHLKQITSFYKKQSDAEFDDTIKEDLKILNQKLMRMYDVVKNDPQYMKRNYKVTANTIQSFLNNNHNDYVPYNNAEDQQSDPENEQNFTLDKRVK